MVLKIKTPHLEYSAAVDENKHVARVTEVLIVSQPELSKRLRRREGAALRYWASSSVFAGSKAG
jgi:hypothetical protein